MQRLLRRVEVERLTALSRSTIYLLMSRGEFPPGVLVSKRARRWPADDVQRWIASKRSDEETAAPG